MNRDEAKRLLARMTAAWPKPELTAPTAEVWIEHLASKRLDLAVECLRDLETGLQWVPSLAEFQVEYDAKVHYETVTRAEERGLPSPAPQKAPPEIAAKYLAEMREKIKRGKETQQRRVRERAAEMGRILAEHEERIRG